MVCPEVLKMFEDIETDVMLNAQKEGLSPRYARAFYKMATHKEPVQNEIACIEAFGFDHVKEGVPNICPGTACLRKETTDECVQYRNEEHDGTILMVSKTESAHDLFPMVKVVGKTLLIHNLDVKKKYTAFLYVGNEKNLKDIKLGYCVLRCPNTDYACGSNAKIYRLESIKDCLIGLVSDRDYKLYRRLAENAVSALESKKQDYCESVHGKPGC